MPGTDLQTYATNERALGGWGESDEFESTVAGALRAEELRSAAARRMARNIIKRPRSTKRVVADVPSSPSSMLLSEDLTCLHASFWTHAVAVAHASLIATLRSHDAAASSLRFETAAWLTRAQVRSSASELERALNELARLRDGWAGAGTKCPSSDVLRDVEHALAAFEHGTAAPEVEVDSEDGSVTLVWRGHGGAFSLIAAGTGRVSGVLSPYREWYKPWTLPATEVERIARRLEEPEVARLLTGQ